MKKKDKDQLRKLAGEHLAAVRGEKDRTKKRIRKTVIKIISSYPEARQSEVSKFYRKEIKKKVKEK